MDHFPADEAPIVNCHAHIFTAGHVPPYLAKTFVPWPFYYLLPVSGIVRIFKWWNREKPPGPGKWPFQPWYKAWVARRYFTKEFIARHVVLNFLYNIAGLFLTLQAFFILYGWISSLVATDSAKTGGLIADVRDCLTDYHVLYPLNSWLPEVALVVVVCLFYATGRNLILFIFRNLWKFMGSLPGKQTLELLKRYVNIGRYAFHDQQETTFRQLRGQYPVGTRFVILPMDMEYMDAGTVRIPYRQQMEDLVTLKEKHPKELLPFVAVDPRRIVKEPDFFAYEPGMDGRIVLKDCLVKTYIEEKGFAGFKIYPALGYYPFDAALLPLWKYAAENGLPITTHCIRGTIFYRGEKKKEWDKHPIFQQSKGDGEFEPLLLPETKNIQFINNFTHPLNYLCLLDKDLLKQVVQMADARVQEAFGYDPATGSMRSDLCNLKLCFGHFGGDDEWARYFELDRFGFAAQLDTCPDKGIDFTHLADGQPSKGKPELIWKYVDWYSIICSMMLQYPNVYADISFIVHNPAIVPLLTRTLQRDRGQVRERVLYGTDFYVVRNYKSDKNMLADMLAGLTEEEFALIARENPERFLGR